MAVLLVTLAITNCKMRPQNLHYALRFICEFRSEGGKPRGMGWWAGKIATRQLVGHTVLEPKWQRLKHSGTNATCSEYDPEHVRYHAW